MGEEVGGSWLLDVGETKQGQGQLQGPWTLPRAVAPRRQPSRMTFNLHRRPRRRAHAPTSSVAAVLSVVCGGAACALVLALCCCLRALGHARHLSSAGVAMLASRRDLRGPAPGREIGLSSAARSGLEERQRESQAAGPPQPRSPAGQQFQRAGMAYWRGSAIVTPRPRCAPLTSVSWPTPPASRPRLRISQWLHTSTLSNLPLPTAAPTITGCIFSAAS